MQDDSNLKCFTIDPKDMLGMSDSIPNDDTKLASELDNYVLSASGLYTLPKLTNIQPSAVTLPTQRVWGKIYEVPGEDYPYLACLANITAGNSDLEIRYCNNSLTTNLLYTEGGVINTPSIFSIKKIYNAGDYTYMLEPGGMPVSYTHLTLPTNREV